VKSVDGLSRLFDACLQPAGDLAQQDHGRGWRRGCLRVLDDGKAGHRLALGVVGGAFGEVRLLVILVAFGFADGDGHGQVEAAEELFDIDGVLASATTRLPRSSSGTRPLKCFGAFATNAITAADMPPSDVIGERFIDELAVFTVEVIEEIVRDLRKSICSQ
jgi:hypothetical protein